MTTIPKTYRQNELIRFEYIFTPPLTDDKIKSAGITLDDLKVENLKGKTLILCIPLSPHGSIRNPQYKPMQTIQVKEISRVATGYIRDGNAIIETGKKLTYTTSDNPGMEYEIEYGITNPTFLDEYNEQNKTYLDSAFIYVKIDGTTAIPDETKQEGFDLDAFVDKQKLKKKDFDLNEFLAKQTLELHQRLSAKNHRGGKKTRRNRKNKPRKSRAKKTLRKLSRRRRLHAW